ncbi:hypothetical protein JI739_17565 [Ramlibacter sp. AW1]|uniref:Uncharacterized protein n=1 Tax=Ramlibacter aurantiacus TaxID=2801330 RepID=A0A936ZW13_9BURK|nr:hypothetical protein [Ramlibacter aurantiacus]MBL0422160.1 hypothetical protein [Ramlibacter aurantiacus]
MTSAEYLIESNHPLAGRLLALGGGRQVLVGDRGLAISLAAKNFVPGSGQEIRVIHVPTGEIVFRKEEASSEAFSEDL